MTTAARSAGRTAAHDASAAPRTQGLVGRTVHLFVLMVVLLIGMPTSASAHSEVERSDPPNGGMVQAGRTDLTLWFGEAITESGSSFSVRSQEPAAKPLQTTATLDDGDTVVHLTAPPLDRGTYTITWAVVADDGHPTRGTIIFGVGFRPDGIPGSEARTPEPLPVSVRLADLFGTLLALGALSVLGRVVPVLRRGGIDIRRRVIMLGLVGALVSLAAAVATPLLTVHSQLGSFSGLPSAVRDMLLGSTWGLLWLARLGGLVVAAVALGSARRRLAPERPVAAGAGHAFRAVPVAGIALAVSAVLDASAGHASTLPSRSGLAIVAAALHVLAAGVWAGGLMTLVLTVVPIMRLGSATRRPVVRDTWRAFGPMAAVASGVLVSTGIYEAGRHVSTVSTLTHDTYGWAVIAKVILVTVALGIAGYNTLVVNTTLAGLVGRLAGQGPGWGPPAHRLRATVVVETTVLVAAVAAAAVMTSVPTAREADAAASVTAPYSETVDGLFVTFEAVPIGARTRIVVRSEAIVRPLPQPVTGIEVGLGTGAPAEDRVVLEAVQPGWYEGVSTVVPSGDWTAEVVLHRSGAPDSVVDVPWTSASTSTATPLELVGSGVALALLVGIGTGVVVWRRRGPRAGRDDAEQDGADVHTFEEVR